jgi:poly(ADP-ribose) glycohydrolase ARH3
MPTMRDRFRGCLIGQAIGDAIGARFEAQSANHIRQRFPSVETLFLQIDGELWYTDDTQMAIGVAETLVACGSISEPRLCEAFVANYIPSRGYGRGTRAVLEAMEEKRDYRGVAERYFPGGSLGNGAAMRAAPVGLMFHRDSDLLWEQARLSAIPTHVHPLSIEGAQLLAWAVGWTALQGPELDREALFRALSAKAVSPEFQQKLTRASAAASPLELSDLGNGIEATESVATAIASFSLFPRSFREAIGHVILLGGDTDTMAAMAGALCGTFLGLEEMSEPLANALESSPKGRDYLIGLADQLYEAHLKIIASNSQHV